MLCPRCEQGDIAKVRVKKTSEIIYVCMECEAAWLKAESIGVEPFFDFGSHMMGIGLEPLWSEVFIVS